MYLIKSASTLLVNINSHGRIREHGGAVQGGDGGSGGPLCGAFDDELRSCFGERRKNARLRNSALEI